MDWNSIRFVDGYQVLILENNAFVQGLGKDVWVNILQLLTVLLQFCDSALQRGNGLRLKWGKRVVETRTQLHNCRTMKLDNQQTGIQT